MALTPLIIYLFVFHLAFHHVADPIFSDQGVQGARGLGSALASAYDTIGCGLGFSSTAFRMWLIAGGFGRRLIRVELTTWCGERISQVRVAWDEAERWKGGCHT